MTRLYYTIFISISVVPKKVQGYAFKILEHS
jgi:hypothetical protein